MSRLDEILTHEAAGWWLRLNERPEDAALRAEVNAWCARSDQHARAFQAAAHMWDTAGEIGAEKPAKIIPLHRRGRVWASITATGIAACLMLALAPQISLRLQADYRTAAGQMETVDLPDGSRLSLDSDSAVAIDFDNAERNVRLLKGRVWFDVARDQAHPFTVRADGAQVVVTGTSFDVDLKQKSVEVGLRDGAVKAGVKDELPIHLRPGEVVRLNLVDGEAEVRTRSPEIMGLWRQKRLLVEDQPLPQAIAELKRYYPGVVVLRGNDLKRARVTGVYDMSDPEQALRALVEPHQARIQTVGGWLTIVSQNAEANQ
ncbi:MAG: FecR domain-containing protein [Asticcacaulis sp.]